MQYRIHFNHKIQPFVCSWRKKLINVHSQARTTPKIREGIQQLQHQKEITFIRSVNQRVYVASGKELLKGSVKRFAGVIGLTHKVVYQALASLIRQGRGEYRLTSNDIDKR